MGSTALPDIAVVGNLDPILIPHYDSALMMSLPTQRSAQRTAPFHASLFRLIAHTTHPPMFPISCRGSRQDHQRCHYASYDESTRPRHTIPMSDGARCSKRAPHPHRQYPRSPAGDDYQNAYFTDSHLGMRSQPRRERRGCLEPPMSASIGTACAEDTAGLPTSHPKT